MWRQFTEMRILCKEGSIKINDIEIKFRKCLHKYEITLPEDNIEVIYKGKSIHLKSVNDLYRTLRRLGLRETFIEKIFEKLYELELCVRCGTCCTTGAPPITLSDASKLVSDSNVVETLFKVTNMSIDKISEVTIFLVWNAALPLMRPCPFLHYSEDGLATCRIYEIRPTFCRMFKCWSPYTDRIRKQHIQQVISEIKNLSVGNDLAQLRETALRTLMSIQVYVSDLF